jgi:5-carboxymethyl-2-hydroxymuconic-semialdehyde dehydrogenase
MPIFAGPVVGPVVRVTPFDTAEEAGSLANAVAHPVTTYLWTSDLERALGLASAVGSASTWVNSHNRHDLVHATAIRPAAAGGAAAIGFYTQSRTMLIAADDTPVPRFGA